MPTAPKRRRDKTSSYLLTRLSDPKCKTPYTVLKITMLSQRLKIRKRLFTYHFQIKDERIRKTTHFQPDKMQILYGLFCHSLKKVVNANGIPNEYQTFLRNINGALHIH